MTVVEKVEELQNIKPPLGKEEFESRLNAYKASQPKEEVKEELKEDAKVDSKETKDKPESNTETEGNSNDSANADQGVESGKSTKSDSESGDLQPSEKNDFDFLNGDLSEVLKDDTGFKEGVQKRQQEAYDKYTSVAKPEEVVTKGGWDMKYTADGSYYTKKEGSENWIELEKGTTAFGGVSSSFGHSEFDLNASRKNSEMFNSVGDIFNPKPKSVAKETKTINDIVSSDTTGAFVVPVETSASVNKQIAAKQEEMNSLGFKDNVKIEKLQEEINALKSSIDPVQTAIFKTEQFNKDTSLSDKQVNSIRQKTIDFMEAPKMVPEIKEESKQVKIGSEGGKPIYSTETVKTKTGRMIPNPELTDLQAEAKSDLAAKMGIDVKDLEETPEIQEELDAIIRSKYSSGLESKAKDANIKEWIHSNRDVFTKGESQERQALYAKINQLDVNKRENQVLTTVKDAQNDIGAIRKALKQLSEADYQSQEEVDKANGLFEKLKNQEKKLIGVYESEYEKIDDILTDKKSLAKNIDFLERNYSYTANFVTSAGMAGVDLAQGVEEVLFRLADAPNAFNFADNKVFTALAPFNAMASALVDSDSYKEKRKEINETIDSYQDGITEGMAKPVELSEISSLADVGMFSAQMVGSQIPNTAILMASGGAGLFIMGASSGGSSFKEMQTEIDESKKIHDAWIEGGSVGEEPAQINYTPYQMYGVAMLNSATEILSEKVSFGIIKRSQKAFNLDSKIKKGFVDQIKSVFTKQGARAVKTYGIDVAGESLSEGGVEFASNIFDNVILGKNVPLLEGVPTSMVSGAMMSGLVYKAPGFAKGIVSMTQSADSNQIIKQNYDQIKELEISLRPPNVLSSKARGIVTNKIAGLVKDSSNEINKGLQRFTTMPIESVRELSQIESNIFGIRQDMETLNKETGFTEGKEAAIKQLKDNLIKQQVKKSELIEANAEFENVDGEVALTSRQIKEGSEVVANQLGDTGITGFDNTEDLLGGFEALKAQGIQLEVTRDPDTNEILPAEDQGYGLIATLPNGTQQVIINNASSEADGVIPADKHEVFHAFASKVDPDKKLKMGMDLYDSLQNDSNITVDIDTKGLLDQYKKDLDDGSISEADFYEEVMAVTSDALTPDSKGNTGIKIKEVSALKALGNKILETVGWKQSFKDGNQVLDFLKAFNKDVISGKGLSQETLDTAGVTLDEVDMGLNDDAVDLGTVKKSQKPNISPRGVELTGLVKEGLITNEGLIDIINSPSSTAVDKFGAIDAVVESNWPVISKGLKFNPTGTIPMADVKTAVTEQMQGIFPGRNKPLMADFNAGTAQVNTYLGSLMGVRQAEILQRASEIAATSTDSTSIDSDQAKQVVDTSTTTSSSDTSKSDKVAKKPTETTQYSDTNLENLGVETQEQIELQTTEAVQDSFKDSEVTRFGETRNIPQAIADIYGKMFGINPQTIVDKTRNYQNYDAAGLTAAKQFLLKNAANDFSRLPKTKDGFGKGTFLPRNVMAALYTDGVLTGNLKDYINLLRQKPTKPIYRDALGQTIRGLLNLNIRNRMFETLVPTTPKRLQGGAKFSRKKPKPLNSQALESKVAEVMQTSGINDVKSELNIKEDITVTNKNRESRIASVLNTIISGKIPAPALSLLKLQNFGASRKQDSKGVYYYDLTNGKTIIGTKGLTSAGKVKYTLPTQKAINDKYGPNVTIKPSRGSLYYGVTDINYENAIKAAELNNKFYSSDIISNLENAKRVTIKPDSKLDTKSKKTRQAQEAINMNALNDFVNILNTGVQGGQIPLNDAALLVAQAYQGTTGLIKIAAPFEGVSDVFEKAPSGTKQATRKIDFIEEHSPPASSIGAAIIAGLATNNVSEVMQGVRDNFVQVQLSNASDVLIDMAGFSKTLPKGISILTPNAGYIRLSASGINMNSITDLKSGKSVAELMNVGVNSKASKKNPNIVYAQNSLINEQAKQDDAIDGKTAQARIEAYEPIASLELKSGKVNVDSFGDKIDTDMTIQEQIDVLGTYDKAATLGRKLDQPVRKIRVFDFDDTLARTKSNVLYTMPDGTTGKIDAATFAKEAGNMEAEGVEWDFSEFSKVMQGSKGPLLDVAKIIADKRGTDDVFVLTARPADAAGPIKEFLASMGLDIPLANITGLGDGAPSAKGNWIAQKAADGYNDFYFADDHTGNVKAVKEVLDQIDVKSKVQLAKASKKKVFNEIFNDIIEDSTGIESYKTYSPARAQTIGASKGKWNFLIPASAEDFTGLLYRTLGKGKKGDAQMAFYKTNLLDPYNKAEIAVVNAKIQAANDFKALKSNLKTLPKSLSKLTGIGGFTFSNAVRVAAWTRQGMEVPGLSKRDVKELNDFVSKNAELNTFVDELIKIQKGKPYPKPKDSWLAGSITTDITQEIEKVNRKEYMQEFLENADIIFSEENLSKLEAAYGSKYVEALKDNLRRMKSGSNRPIGGSRVANQVLDWLNNSVGAVMFLNTRSAILQTLSAVNFIQVSGPNNILAAGKAFANQKQYWSDFMTLMNSPYLVERRNGLKINVSESEIADAVAESSNKPKAALAFLLSKGFVMTRFADSFAIASGGSTFYRNTVDALVKGGMDQKAAEKQAFDEFRTLSEESQQSSNPSKISQQQASGAGRVILAFANTPMQYARIIKRSSQDLINGRGDWKTNVSKIAYYGVMQNVIFNSLQTALFALAFDDEEDEEKKDAKLKSKTGRIVNGMVDSLLKGGGIAGVAVGSLKNALMTIAEENDKKSPNFSKAIDDLIGFSPPLSAKFRKLKSAANSFSWNRKEIKEEGFNLNNPAYLASAQVISGLTNIPVDRAIKKLNNIRSIFSDTSAKWQKVALGLGWSTWDVGLPFYGVKDKEVETPETILRDKIITLKKDTNTKEQKQMLLDLGLSKKDIKKLKYEEDRVKKIIALQNKKKK